MSNQLNEKVAINSLKNEVARELGVQFQEDSGHLTARECGSVGGEMVKRMVEQYKGSTK